METFKTQFVMSGVPTDVSVQVINDTTFACTLNLADFFDGGEFEGAAKEPDFTLIYSPQGTWEIEGESKVTLTAYDIENLGNAIDTDYISRNNRS
jgi:hypothetical protein